LNLIFSEAFPGDSITCLTRVHWPTCQGKLVRWCVVNISTKEPLLSQKESDPIAVASLQADQINYCSIAP